MTIPELLAALDGYRLRQEDENYRMAVLTSYMLNAWVDTAKSGKITPERILGKSSGADYNAPDDAESRAQERMRREGVLDDD